MTHQANHARATRSRPMPGGALATALGVCLFAAAGAKAAPVTFYFSGTVGSIYEPSDVINASVAVGTAFHGHYTFDPGATDTNADPDIGWYESSGAQYEYVVHIGDYTFTSIAENFSSIDINVNADDTGSDSYNVHSAFVVTASPALDEDVVAIESRFSLIDGDRTAFNSADLPLTPPSLNPFGDSGSDFNNFVLHGLAGGGASPLLQVRGDIATLTPEPTSGALALLGLGGAAMLNRRRRRR